MDTRPSSLVATCDQWVRATHDGTAVDGSAGDLTLTWTTPDPPPPAEGGCRARGLATDRLCRVYRLLADRVERLAVGPTANGVDYAALPAATVVFGAPKVVAARGPDFRDAGHSAALDPTGIAVDDDDRLLLADGTAGTISVVDLWSRRLLRVVTTATPDHPDRAPVGLGHRAGVSFGVLRQPAALVRLSATRGPDLVEWPAAVADLPPTAQPARVAVLADGTPVVLFVDGSTDGWLIAGDRPPRSVGPASDIAVDADGAVVVAPCPSQGTTSLARFDPTSTGWTRAHPLDATGYDGGGVVVTRDGRVGYFSASGFRLAVIARVDYATAGSCTTYRLDSGTPRNRWGRVLLEACVPEGTACLVAAVTSDDEAGDGAATIGHAPPEPAACVPATAASPPLPPVALAGGATAPMPLHRRRAATTPWWWGDERYVTLEAPVMAPPGRYLWVTVHLTGNRRRTPKVRELRVERTSHSLLRRLPAVFSADRDQAEFLHRYLALADGFLEELDVRSRCRDILVDPHGTPVEALDWLASFLGLVLDDRWSQPARRQLVSEIAALYRRRGTPWALGRYLEILLEGVAPVIIEHFRLRGVGGPLLGADPTETSRSVLGSGFRVGGAVGDLTGRPLDVTAPATSPFTSTAHRFTVLIPRPLDADTEAAARHVLDTERPAHTVYELCRVDAGMRAGDGLHVGISSIVGPTGAFDRAVVGRSAVGTRTLLGSPWSGIPTDGARLGQGTRVG